MPEESRNIYKSARRSAGLTQEAAAERLGISVESIRAYETSNRIPPNDVVERMVICYNTQYLAYQHLHETNELMGRIVPELKERSLMEFAMRVHNRMRSIDRKGGIDRLMEIAEDNRIDIDERKEYDDLMADLKEISKCWLEAAVYVDGANSGEK